MSFLAYGFHYRVILELQCVKMLTVINILEVLAASSIQL